MRLIDVDELKRRIIAFSTGCHTTYLTVANIIMLLNQSDTVDAKPVVHGRWVKPPRHKTHCKCSNCGRFPIRGMPNYCPNCGADMREGDGNG